MAGHEPTSELTRPELQAALDRVLRARVFNSSPRMSQFLRFVVEAELGGRGTELKESTVAVEVFARGSDFDQRIDTIVRVQAVRLRSKLVEHYAADGASDEVRIDLPSGGYRPGFRRIAVAPSRATKTAPDKSIAVLPFADMSPAHDQEYLGDGIAEELLHLLARAPEMCVAARTSSFQFKNRNLDVRQIGESLGVEFILEGSVRKWDNRIRVTAQLLNAQTGFHMWSEAYDRTITDVLSMQDELAAAILSRLLSQTGPAETRPRTGPPVYDLCLMARHAFNQQTPIGFLRAKDLFGEALQGDPQYAPAWTGLAMTLAFMACFGMGSPCDLFSEALQAALRALELSPQLPEGHLAFGLSSLFDDFDFAAAYDAYQSALRLDPSSGLAHDWLALAHACGGDFAEARMHSLAARRLDPLSPTPAENEGLVVYLSRQHEESIELYSRLLERFPGYPLAWMGVAWNRLALGQPVEAVAATEKAKAVWGSQPFVLGTLGLALARAGRLEEAEQCLRSLREAGKSGYVSSWEIAVVLLGLGDRDGALTALEQAWAERAWWMVFLQVNPVVDSLRDEPRFQALASRLTPLQPQQQLSH